jgi:hypothetical protein
VEGASPSGANEGKGGAGAGKAAASGSENEEYWRSIKTHHLGLHSSYVPADAPIATATGTRTTGEPSFTTGSQGTVDYIWYSQQDLAVDGYLEMPAADEIDPSMGFKRRSWDHQRHRYACQVGNKWVPQGQDMLPSYSWGSDHLSLVTQLRFVGFGGCEGGAEQRDREGMQ